MKRLSLLALALAGAATLSAADHTGESVTQARAIVKEFLGNLLGELQTAMKEGGPVNAISACNLQAPAIAERLARDTSWGVGRTSLKLRNPANRPDEWERSVLEQFEQRKAAGEDLSMMEYSEVVESDGKRTFRYMKAIPTAQVCLNCHGAQLAPEVQAKLAELYPGDQATGFQAGDIRGAFTLSQPLQPEDQ